MASIPTGGLKPIKGPAAGVLKKMSKKTGVSSTASFKPTSVKKGEVVEELNFDLGAESTVKPKIVDDFLDKKYKIDTLTLRLRVGQQRLSKRNKIPFN